MLWDTAGQEEFDSITKAYYRGVNICLFVCICMSACMFITAAITSPIPGAQACVLAFSTVDRESFEAIELWKNKVKHTSHSLPHSQQGATLTALTCVVCTCVHSRMLFTKCHVLSSTDFRLPYQMLLFTLLREQENRM